MVIRLPANDNDQQEEVKLIACASCRSHNVQLFLDPPRILCAECCLDMTTDCLDHMELMPCHP